MLLMPLIYVFIFSFDKLGMNDENFALQWPFQLCGLTRIPILAVCSSLLNIDSLLGYENAY